ncbi:hypothetical protein AVEN_115469-1, partial [Araneus ventricosus]
VNPFLPWHPVTLNNSRCNSSSTEVGVLMAITGRAPPLTRRIHSLEGVTQPPPLLYLQEKPEPAFLSGSFSSMNSWCPPPWGVMRM